MRAVGNFRKFNFDYAGVSELVFKHMNAEACVAKDSDGKSYTDLPFSQCTNQVDMMKNWKKFYNNEKSHNFNV